MYAVLQMKGLRLRKSFLRLLLLINSNRTTTARLDVFNFVNCKSAKNFRLTLSSYLHAIIIQAWDLAKERAIQFYNWLKKNRQLPWVSIRLASVIAKPIFPFHSFGYTLQIIVKEWNTCYILDGFGRRYQCVSCHASVSVDRQLIIITLVGHRKGRVLGISSFTFVIFHIKSKHHVSRCGQTMKIIISQPELAPQISKSFFVRCPVEKEVYGSIHAPLKSCPTAAISCHVTQHLNGFLFVRINPVHAVSSETVLVKITTVSRAF